MTVPLYVIYNWLLHAFNIYMDIVEMPFSSSSMPTILMLLFSEVHTCILKFMIEAEA